jgi:hypothetical protein
MKMKVLKGLRIVALAGLIMFVSQLGHVAHAIDIDDMQSATSNAEDAFIRNMQTVPSASSCELANGEVFTIDFGTDTEAADEFEAMCETAQLQLLWYHNLVLWTSASCNN